MKSYTAAELAEVIELHGKWLRDDDGGSRANLYGANLSHANLSRANLYGADLSRANLSHADLSGANLSGADLYGANLYGANLSGANLSGADLYGANLYGANLSGANLYGADLSGANLYGADLSRANLSGADLSRADLYGANLSHANLSRANLRCMGNLDNIKTIQADRWQIGYTHDTLQIGCQCHLITEWWAFSDDEISRMDSKALAWWGVWKPILQAMIAASPAAPTGYVKNESEQ
jgi:uncharacterized protein YjbI with pentapeptide repeats